MSLMVMGDEICLCLKAGPILDFHAWENVSRVADIITTEDGKNNSIYQVYCSDSEGICFRESKRSLKS